MSLENKESGTEKGMSSDWPTPINRSLLSAVTQSHLGLHSCPASL